MKNVNKKSKKRIVVIHIITRLAIGGAQENTLLTVLNLNKNFFSPLLVSGEELTEEGNLLDWVRKENMNYHVNNFLVRSISPVKDLLCLITLTKFLRQHKASVVHTHSSKAGIIGRIAALFAGSRIIVHTVHGWNFCQRTRKWEIMLSIFLERLTAKFTDKLICVSKQDVLKGLQHNIGDKNKYTVIRSGFNIARFKNSKVDKDTVKKKFGLPLNKKIVGSVGRLSYPKDPETIVNIASLISKKRGDVIFVLVGDGDLRCKVEKLIMKSGLKERVYLLGAHKDVENIFPIFDVFLLASLSEGLPRVIPQAMVSGIPVVSTAVGGVVDIIVHNKNGFLSKTKDAMSMADYIRKLLDNKKLCKKFVFNSLPLIKQFDFSLMVRNIEDVYLDLLERN